MVSAVAGWRRRALAGSGVQGVCLCWGCASVLGLYGASSPLQLMRPWPSPPAATPILLPLVPPPLLPPSPPPQTGAPAPLIAEDVNEIIQANAARLDAAIDYTRDYECVRHCYCRCC